MTNFEKVAAGPAELGGFLKTLNAQEAPWREMFQDKYCAQCGSGNCADCPHEEYRDNPEWWLCCNADEVPEIVRKRDFVERELSCMLIKADADIYGAEYLTSAEGEEYVLVFFRNGHIKNICVTADSMMALARDVLRVL